MADPTDILTIEEAAASLNLGDPTPHAATLPRLITAVSRRLDAQDLVGPVVIRTVTDEAHDGSDWFHGCPTRSLRLKRNPVSEVTTITESDGTTPTVLTVETNLVHPVAGYRLVDADTGKVTRRSSGSAAAFPAGEGNVVVTYEAGRFASTSAVDDLFKEAAEILLNTIWRGDQGGGSKTFGAGQTSGLPFTRAAIGRVRDLLAAELRLPGIH